MFKKQLLVVVIVNLIIASLFYINDANRGYTALASDQHNIVPMCIKLDNPSLYQNDLFLNDITNFKYYTPFFISPLRSIAKSTNGDYMQAMLILLWCTHLLYGITWFLLFYKVFNSNFWIALLLSILIRGIVWLPGYEFWGISSIWTLTPRTIYAALLPIPFIFLFTKNPVKLLISFFAIGFIFNMHPITGLGGILIYLGVITGMLYFKNKILSFRKVSIGFGVLILGMLPFVLTYFGKTDIAANYDTALYNKAFTNRIPEFFQNPVLFSKKWLKLKMLFFVVPTLFFFWLAYKKKVFVPQAKMLAWLLLLLFVFPFISIYVEQWINSTFKLNIRMSFQLIRIQKLLILPMYFAIGYLFLYGLKSSTWWSQKTPLIVAIYFTVIGISGASIFNGIPFISDDITRTILPNWNSLSESKKDKQTDFDKMALFISEHTKQDAILYGDYRMRAAAKRPMVLDKKGASILIEGNPARFIEWNQNFLELKSKKGIERISFLKQQKVQYIVTSRNDNNFLVPIKQIGDFKLYKLN